MILCDREIELALDQSRLIITPRPSQAMIDSTAIDLRLGDSLDVWQFPPADARLGQKPLEFCPGAKDFKVSELEAKYTAPIHLTEEGWCLSPSPPNNFVLGWTEERIYFPHTSRLCARVEGKSSLARLGVGVHVTAPTVHAGFGHNDIDPKDHGRRLRLEIWNVGPLPIRLVKGLRICQLILEEVREVPRSGYQGQFNMQGPKPQPSSGSLPR